jgi:hypothetical protein
MILANTRAGAEATRKRYVTGDGLESSVVRYFGMTASANPAEPPHVGALYPVAFRVEQDPDTVSEPHFHQANQFQVFVEGDGFLGKTKVGEVTVQYAGAYTPYGPIVAGPRGVAYMTLRNGWDPGALFMPGARDRLKRFAKKPRAIVTSTVVDAEPVTGRAREELIAPGPDGLAAACLRLAAGETFTGPDPSSGGGQYWVGLAGADINPATPLPRLACLFVGPDERPHAVTAGPAGLQLLVLQFPRLT